MQILRSDQDDGGPNFIERGLGLYLKQAEGFVQESPSADAL